ncbi:MAG: glycosyltransferase family 2 protein [Candidatus Omnitrophica bacterium]|nr:glycosyltransferase family 2 protein [Candidatus Omnitrophota bacterium]
MGKEDMCELKITPFVSVIVACRNEEKGIKECVESVIAQDYPQDRLEVLFVDGRSVDRTREIIEGYTGKHFFLKVIDNPRKNTPAAFNAGIRSSKGDLILFMGAHSIYQKDYVTKCVESSLKYKADNVGGAIKTRPYNSSFVAKAIAIVLSHPFGVGNSIFRIGSKKPVWVDTVFGGCYKREVFRQIGLFDEELVRNQDDEFNLRLRRNGGKILLIPEVVSYYYARDSFDKLARMYWQYGYFKPLVMVKLKAVLTWRQLVPAVFVSTLLLAALSSFFLRLGGFFFVGLASFYLFVVLGVSFGESINRKTIGLFVFLVFAFFVIHFSYGIGYLFGVKDFVAYKKRPSESDKVCSTTR